jgi:nucleotide-binding universal stress UspA family protein
MSDHTSDRIVVAVDGSAPSDAAVRWAAQEAAMRETPLTLMHVVRPGLPMGGLGYSRSPLPMNYGDLAKQDGLRILAEARAVIDDVLTTGDKVSVRTELALSPPIPALIDVTKDAQTIVLGCRGHSALSRHLLGSVSTALIHHAHCPVAVIHETTDGPLQDSGPVVVGIDGSPASELATSMAFDEASRRGAALLALHAWIDADATSSAIPRLAWSDFQSEAEETLAERLAGWSERYPDVTVHRRVVFDKPARHLLEAAQSAQLVVVGSHGRGGFAGMLLGSVSSTVVHAIHRPVIVARRG